jgi:hypothetical protein
LPNAARSFHGFPVCARACVIEVKVAVRPLQEKCYYSKSQGCKAINFQPGDAREDKAETFDVYITFLMSLSCTFRNLQKCLGSRASSQGKEESATHHTWWYMVTCT